MEPKIISNQVYEAMQIPSLPDDPTSRGVILYANKYSGIQSVDMTDPELLDLINSTIGMSGPNVIIQLKKKMEKFRNGPWFIDSKNGVIYIHNRKLNQESVNNYIYQRENGELLYASFTMEEVHKPLAGFKSFIDGITKTVNAATSQLKDVVLESQMKIDEYLANPRHVEEPDKLRVDKPRNIYNVLAELEGKERHQKIEANDQYKIYSSKDKDQLKSESAKRAEESYSLTNKKELAKEYWENFPQWEMYQNACRNEGYNSESANRLLQEMIQESKGKYVELKSNEDWREAWTYLSTGDIVESDNKPSRNPNGAQAAIDHWKDTHPGCKFLSIEGYTWKEDGIVMGMKGQGPEYPGDPFGATGTYTKRWMGYVRIKFFGYGKIKSYVQLDRLLKDTMPRYKTPNLNFTIPNATANLGRGKKEKRLRATIRVVGNPVLESMQQIGIYNVGKKNSGPWYIKSVDHSFEFGQGYICEIELSKQIPKPGSSGKTYSIGTQGFTEDTTPASTKSTITSTSGKQGGKGSTGSKSSSGSSTYTQNPDGSITIGNFDSATLALFAEVISNSRTAKEAKQAEYDLAQRYVAHQKKNQANGTNEPFAKWSTTKGKDGKVTHSIVVTSTAQVDKPVNVAIEARTYQQIVDMVNNKK